MNAFQILMMSSEYSNEKLYNKCCKVATNLEGKLPYSHFHPYGRNANAHVFQMIKKKYKCSYKKVINKKELWDYLNWIEANPR